VKPRSRWTEKRGHLRPEDDISNNTIFDDPDAKVVLLRTRASFWLRSAKDDDAKGNGKELSVSVFRREVAL
jgi:hypothetical protein